MLRGVISKLDSIHYIYIYIYFILFVYNIDIIYVFVYTKKEPNNEVCEGLVTQCKLIFLF